jgi:S-adenosylmethionine hydrolase
VIYIDHYGNALTGLRAAGVPRATTIGVRGERIAYARVFAEAGADRAFWYENSIGLIEIAIRSASAAERLGIGIGDPLTILG